MEWLNKINDAIDYIEDNKTEGVENRETAEYRLPLFLSYPIKYKKIVCMPLIGEADLSPWLHSVQGVSAGGEWGKEARELDYDWVLKIREQCINAGVSFNFWRTGQRFRKDGVLHVGCWEIRNSLSIRKRVSLRLRPSNG